MKKFELWRDNKIDALKGCWILIYRKLVWCSCVVTTLLWKQFIFLQFFTQYSASQEKLANISQAEFCNATYAAGRWQDSVPDSTASRQSVLKTVSSNDRSRSGCAFGGLNEIMNIYWYSACHLWRNSLPAPLIRSCRETDSARSKQKKSFVAQKASASCGRLFLACVLYHCRETRQAYVKLIILWIFAVFWTIFCRFDQTFEISEWFDLY